ncbi:MAG: nucleotidyltransferase family protein [Planctomycetes bacterium]|nr:nucleotidyltransferase family protein [Planctomycetota bacterium]
MDEPIPMDDALFAFADKLERAGIEYMLTGSLALCFHAEPRDTNDVDIVIKARVSDVPTILAMFPEEEGWYWNEDTATRAIENEKMFNVVQSLSGFKFDLIALKSSEIEQEKFARRVRYSKDGRTIWVIRPEDLLLSKLEWGKRNNSALQATDVRTLLRDVPDLDWQYLNPRIDRLGLRKWFEDARTA